MKPAALKVTLYSLPGCQLCRRFRAFLVAHKVRFNEVNVLVRPRVLRGRLSAYRKSLPLAVIGGRILCGWNRTELTRALARFRQPEPPPRRRQTAASHRKP